MNYAIRVTATAEELKPWFSRIALNATTCVAYEHPAGDAERTHCHAIILGLRVTDTTLDNWLKAHLNRKILGNKFFSKKSGYKPHNEHKTRPVDLNFIAYMSKGKYDPCFQHGCSDEVITSQKASGLEFQLKLERMKAEGRPSEAVKLWDEFNSWIYNLQEKMDDDIRCQPLHYIDLRKYALDFLMLKYGAASSKCMNDRAMLVRTYVYYNKIPTKTGPNETEDLWKIK